MLNLLTLGSALVAMLFAGFTVVHDQIWPACPLDDLLERDRPPLDAVFNNHPPTGGRVADTEQVRCASVIRRMPAAETTGGVDQNKIWSTLLMEAGLVRLPLFVTSDDTDRDSLIVFQNAFCEHLGTTTGALIDAAHIIHPQGLSLVDVSALYDLDALAAEPVFGSLSQFLLPVSGESP